MNKKIVGPIAFVVISTLAGFSFLANAESTVVTSKGTFKCDNACVVDSHGNVTDSAGGHVWMLLEDDGGGSDKE